MSPPRGLPPHHPGQPGCPLATAHLPGTGGYLAPEPADFRVDEIPAYAPSGEGTHFFVRIRKTGLTTAQAKGMLAQAAGVGLRSVGSAGRKDKWAVTTQWFSLPAEPKPVDDDRLEILEVARHGQKLRMGHLKGNRFTVVLRGVHPEAAARLPALQAAIERGVPNYYGEQRFGLQNVQRALDLLDAGAPRHRRGNLDPEFLASALQSAVFNHWLGWRITAGDLYRLVPGDVLQKRDSGGVFTSEDAAADGPRVESGEVVPTGPMIGPKCFAAADRAALREQSAIAAFGLTPERLAALARLAPGSRRPATLIPQDLQVSVAGDQLHAAFTLPKGAFATVVLAELAHPEGNLRRRADTPEGAPPG